MATSNLNATLGSKAFRYIRNVGKSFGYMAIDTAKSYNPQLSELSKQTREFSSDIYKTIKDLKSGNNQTLNEAKNLANDTWKDFWKNAKEDLMSGELYNKQRIQERSDEQSNAMMKSMGLDFDFDMDFDDDFGDFDDEESAEIKAEKEGADKNVKATIASAKITNRQMDIVGGRVANTINQGTAKSTEYLAEIYSRSTKSIVSGMNNGFAETLKGLSGINKNIASLVSLSEPLVAHMQNSTTFYSQSREFQNKALDYLKQIAENTKVGEAKGSASSRKGVTTINDLITDGVLDMRSYMDMVSANFKDATSLFTDVLEMMGGPKATLRTLTASPLSSIVKMAVGAAIPTVLKDSMKMFNGMLENAFTSILGDLRNGSTGNFIFDMIKDIFLPKSDFKKEYSTDKYNKGPVRWDGIARKALIEVIPEKLSQIVALLSGSDDIDVYDYNRGKWTTKKAAKKEHREEANRMARNSSDFSRMSDSTLDYMVREGKMDKKTADAMKKQIESFMTASMLSGSGGFNDVIKRNAIYNSKMKTDYGLDEATFNYIQDILSSTESKYVKDKNGRMVKKFRGDPRSAIKAGIYRAQDQWGRNIRSGELNGDAAVMATVNNSTQSFKGGLLGGADKFGNTALDYLRGIYENTLYGGGKGGRKRRGSLNFKTTQNTAANEIEAQINYISGSVTSNLVDEANNTLDEVTKKLSYSAQDYFKKKNKFTNYGQDANKVAEWNSSDNYNDEYEKEYIKASTTVSIGKKLKEKFNDNPLIRGIGSFIEKIGKLMEAPADAMTRLFDSASKNLSDLINGQNDGEKMSIGGFLRQLMSDPVGAIKQMWGDHVKNGEGYLHDMYEQGKGLFHDAGNWVSQNIGGLFGSDNGNAAKGRRITKSGVVTVSEGEMIIPSELNPYYRGITNKRHQMANEQRITRNYFRHLGNFFDGTLEGWSNDDYLYQLKLYSYAHPEIKDEKKLREAFLNDVKFGGGIRSAVASEANKTNNSNSPIQAVKSSAAQLASSIISTFDHLFVGDDSVLKEKFDPRNISKQINKVSLDAIFDLFPEIKGNAGNMIAGGIIGLGGSLLTGGLLSPIVAAGLGSGIALAAKSKKVQDVLFGEEDENGNREGGILGDKGSKIWDFLKKNGKDMGIGGIVGGVAGTVLAGSPVVGLVLGSAIGFAKNSEQVKTYLFGEPNKKDENGNIIQGADIGLFSKALQQKAKEKLPKIGAGVLAGMLIGPFGNPIMNLIGGAAVGFALDTEFAKEQLFGKKDKDGKRKGGAFDLIRENIVDPTKGIFFKLAEEGRHMFRAAGKAITRAFRKTAEFIADEFRTSALNNFLQSSVFGKALAGFAKVVVGGPLGLLSLGLKGVNTGLEKRALRRGWNLRDKNGKLLSAKERSERREALKVGVGSRTDEFDRILSQASGKEGKEDLQSIISGIDNLERDYNDTDALLGTGKGNINRVIRRNITRTGTDFNIASINEDIRWGRFDDALRKVKSSSFNNEDQKSEVIKMIEEQQKLYEKRDKLKSTKKSLLNTYGARDLDNVKDLINTELQDPRFSKEVQVQDSVISIPEYLKTIVSILKDPTGDHDKEINDLNNKLKGQGIKDKIAAQSKKVEKEPKEGDEKDENGDHMIYHNGQWIKKEDYDQDVSFKDKLIANVPFLSTISNGITNFTNTLGNIRDFFLGDKENNKKGIFEKIHDFLFDENKGVITGLVTFFKDPAKLLEGLKGIAFTAGGVASFLGFGASMAGLVGIGDLLINGENSVTEKIMNFLSDKFTNKIKDILSDILGLPKKEETEEGKRRSNGKSSSGGSGTGKDENDADPNSYYDKSLGLWVDANGKPVEASTIMNTAKADRENSFYHRVVEGDVRRLLSGRKTALGGAAKIFAQGAEIFGIGILNGAKVATKEGHLLRSIGKETFSYSKDVIMARLYNNYDLLKFIEGLLDGIDKAFGTSLVSKFNKFGSTMTERAYKIAEQLDEAAAKKLEKKVASSAIKDAMIGFYIASIIGVSVKGYQLASRYLKIRDEDATTGDRLASAIIAGLKEASTFFAPMIIIDVLIPTSDMVKMIYDCFELGGKEYEKKRGLADAELKAYEQATGKSLSWDQYDTEVLGNYSWDENYSNVATSLGSAAKQAYKLSKNEGKGFWSSAGAGAKAMGESLTSSSGGAYNALIKASQSNNMTNRFFDAAEDFFGGGLFDKNVEKAKSALEEMKKSAEDGDLLGVQTARESIKGLNLGLYRVPYFIQSTSLGFSATINSIIKGGANLFENISEKVGNFITNAKQVGKYIIENSNVTQIFEMAITDESFSFEKFFDTSRQFPNNDAISTIGKVVTIGERIISIPVILVGRKVRAVGKVMEKIGNQVKMIGQDSIENTKRNIDYMLKGDIKSILFGKFAYQEGNFGWPIVNIVDNIEKTSLALPTLLSAGFHKIADGVKFLIDQFVEVETEIKDDQSALREAAIIDGDYFKVKSIGDINDIAEAVTSGDHGVLPNIIRFTVTNLSKTFWSPIALASGALQFVGNGVISLVDGFKEVGKQSIDNQKSLFNLAVKKGDIAGVLKFAGVGNVVDNPIATRISDTIMGLSKFTWVPISIISAAAQATVDLYTSAVEGVKNDYSGIKDSLAKMKTEAENGNISNVWNTYTKWDPFNPVRNVFTVAETIGKIFYSIISVINTIGDPIKEFITDKLGWLENAGKFVDEKINGAKQGASNLYNKIEEKASKGSNLLAGLLGGETYDPNAGGGSGFVSQHDPKYANMRIGENSVYDMGCGPASAVNALGGNNMANAVSIANRYQTAGGTDAAFFADYFRSNGVKANYMLGDAAGGSQEIYDSIASGTPTVLMGRDPSNTSKSRSPFGPYNHYVTARGVNSDGTINVWDPENSGVRRYSSNILRNTSLAVGAGGSRAKIIKFRPKSSFRFGIGAGGGVREDETTKAVWAFLRNECGMSEAAAAGVIGNMQAESGITTTAENSSSHAYGLCQWLGGRKSNLNEFTHKTLGVGMDDLNGQLQFLKYELEQGGQFIGGKSGTKGGYPFSSMTYEQFKKLDDPQEAAVKFEAAFERGENDAAIIKRRIDYAIEYYKLFTGKKFEYKPPKGSVAGKISGANNSSSSKTGYINSSSSESESSKGSLGIMGTITGAFAKLSELFFGKQSTGSTTGDTAKSMKDNQEGQDKSAGLTGDKDHILGNSSAEGDWIHNFPYFNQGEDPWASTKYGNGTIKSSGCGPTSMAMVLKSYGVNTDPNETAGWSVNNGFRVNGIGTSWDYFSAIAKENGLDPVNQFSAKATAEEALNNNIPVIASMRPGDFTKGGHFLVLTGLDGNQLVVNDPGSRKRTGNIWDKDAALSQAKQFWSFTKNGKGSLNTKKGDLERYGKGGYWQAQQYGKNAKSKTGLSGENKGGYYQAQQNAGKGSGIAKLYSLGAGKSGAKGGGSSSKAEAFKVKNIKIDNNVKKYSKPSKLPKGKDIKTEQYLITLIEQLNKIIQINAGFANTNHKQLEQVVEGIRVTSTNLVASFKSVSKAATAKSESKSKESSDSNKEKDKGFSGIAGGGSKKASRSRSFENNPADLNQLKATIDMILAG